ncbi:hypothetical protein [Achromobacter kerstersii]|uniref:hypothetical protein n=1 Tax=Achromobacter kerstersii TaxID=1353890 RepID=UPI00320A8367
MRYGKEWTGGVVVGVIAGVVAGWIWTTIAGWVIATAAKDWWDVAGAMGTVGAVFFSVWTTWRVTSRDAAERQRRVQMAWAQISPELSAAKSNAERAALTIQRMALHGDDYPVRESDIALLRLYSRELSLDQCNAAMQDLAHDDSDRGVRVSALVVEVGRVNRRCTELCDIAAAPPPGFELHAFIVFEDVAAFGSRLDELLGTPNTRTFSDRFRQEFSNLVGMTPGVS